MAGLFNAGTFKHVIIGAGPSGLATAYALLRKGEFDILILEKAANVGGLCKSWISDNGAVFDIGGHSFHTPHPAIKNLVDELMVEDGGMTYRKREAIVRFNGESIPYPFQQNFKQLNNATVVNDCENGLAAKPKEFGTNLRSSLLSKFGIGICTHFAFPYNEKIWKHPLEEMSASWTAERIAETKKGESEMKNDHRAPLESDSVVGYPFRHAFERIFVNLAQRIGNHRIIHNADVVRVAERQKTIIYKMYGCPFEVKYDNLYNTMPLTKLVKCCDSVGFITDNIHNTLRHTSMALVTLRLRKYLHDHIQRIYTADRHSPAHKYCFNNHSSNFWDQTDEVSVMGEVSFIGDEYSPKAMNMIVSETVAWLLQNGFIDRNSFVEDSVAYHIIPFSYPIPTLGRDLAVCRISSELKRHNIFTLGRFGSWSYLNSDGCMNQAFELVDSIA